jgi:hypothetical protein
LAEPEERSYQMMLRTIGAYLDAEGARFVRVVETPTGMVLEYQPDPADPKQELLDLSYQDLLQMTRDLMGRRGQEEDEGTVPGKPSDSYQNFMRALGWELDQMPVSDVLLDEVGDNIVVTYLELDPRQGYVLQKKMAVVEPGERRAILQDAYARREPIRLWERMR